MTTAIYWFRNDLRLHDNPSLLHACAACDRLTFVHIQADDETKLTRWGFPRSGPLRRAFRDMAADGLASALAAKGVTLVRLKGTPVAVLRRLAEQVRATRIYCETIPAPQERAEIAALVAAGLEVRATWQSTLIDPQDLPFDIKGLPEVFSAFRHAVEGASITPRPPLGAPAVLPPASPEARSAKLRHGVSVQAKPPAMAAFPFADPNFHGSETAALAHLARYFQSKTPAAYKATRNGLMGTAYSTKLSPWLAVGALSPRTVFSALRAHEAVYGASDGSYWIWFELLWRDYFRFWSEKHGVKVFRAEGLSKFGPPVHDARAFETWRSGATGEPFVDAGLRELAATGYLSNRLRQVVASYLIHDLAGDWRAGAAWFEAQLIDYDVCSNQGNWLYIAGRGADPRQGRRFNPSQQAAHYDPDGRYRALWAAPTDLSP